MKIAIEGCCHGELDKIYETLLYIQQQDNIKVDLLLICGDFQAVRNKSDLEAMAVPTKYQKMNTFYKYYNGEKKAPVLTVFIGGNHEASNYLQELPYGGWVAPNIYYMGYANVLRFGDVRIGGVSGIYKGRDYSKGHYEHPPYNDSTVRTAYHVRNLEVFRMKQLGTPVDIMLSHDWPRGVYNYGDVEGLLRFKKFLAEEVHSNELGSPAMEELLHHMKPKYWFSAHLHVKFAAMVEHKLDDGETKTTKFLSLDKCLPRRKFLQIIDVPQKDDSTPKLQLDPEWLQILKSTNHLLNLTKTTTFLPSKLGSERYDFTPTEAELKDIEEDFQGMFAVPDNFKPTAPFHNPGKSPHKQSPPQMMINPQTTLMCEMLDLTDPYAVFSGRQTHSNINTDSSKSSLDDSALVDDSSLASEDEDDEDVDEAPTFLDSTLEVTMNSSSVTNSQDNVALDEEESVSTKDSCIVGTSSPKEGNTGSLSELDIQSPISSCQELTSQDSSDGSSSPSKAMNKSPLGKRSPDHLEDTTESENASGVDSPARGKKFKRRNRSCYMGDENV